MLQAICEACIQRDKETKCDAERVKVSGKVRYGKV